MRVRLVLILRIALVLLSRILILLNGLIRPVSLILRIHPILLNRLILLIRAVHHIVLVLVLILRWHLTRGRCHTNIRPRSLLRLLFSDLRDGDGTSTIRLNCLLLTLE